MKHVIKYAAALIFCILLFSCSSMQMTGDEITGPELIDQYPLPPLPSSIQEPTITINLKLFITKDGSVQNVIVNDGRVDKKWLELAKASILKWKYLPAHVSNKPISIWIYQRTIINIVPPKFFFLAEIQFDSLETAQKVYSLLKEDKNFEELARNYSTMSSGKLNGQPTKVNVMNYPTKIRDKIMELNYDDFTVPLKYNGKYVIFKRVKESRGNLNR